MKFTTSTVLKLPISKVINVLDNDLNLMHWQRGLQSFEHLSGNPNMVGGKMKLNYVLGNKQMSLIKTTTRRQIPNELHFQFDMKGIHFLQENYFKSTDNGCTEWYIYNKFVPTSVFTQLMVLFTPNELKKQISQYITDFKNFAEKGISVSKMETVL